jgi:hypothetical protein
MNSPIDVSFVVTSVLLGYVVLVLIVAAVLHIITSTNE